MENIEKYDTKRRQVLAGLIKEGYAPFTESDESNIDEMDAGAQAGLIGAAAGAGVTIAAALSSVVSEYKKIKKENPESKSAVLDAFKNVLQSLGGQKTY